MDGAGTSIDKLYLEVGVNAKGTTRTINSIYKSLDKLTSSISAFDAKGLHKKFDSLFRILNNTDAAGFANLTKNLSGVANAFSKITNASKIDTKGLYAKFNSLTRIITPFVDKVKEGETSLVALSQTLKSMKSPTSTGGGKTSNGGTNKTNENLNIFATLGKWNYMINMARYYGRSLANIVQLSMDYVETQNLWQVANRNNLEMAEQFIQKMNKAYGVSEATLMNYQAIFKNMLSALGDLSDEVSSGLSMQLTQMALDFSSLYNVTIPSAMQKFQAVLSGQVRPIRSVSGYDITENTIFDLYAGAGGEKTMRQLSQIEKRLLRIVAVFDQMGATGATGDMAKTIESASNQARIMNEQFKETMTWAGQLVLIWMDNSKLLQKINAMLITAKEIMRAIVYDVGYSDKNFLDGLVTSAEEAEESVNDIQGKLLSFDKFEALNSNQSNVLGIDQTVLDLLQKINYETQDFQMEANKLSKEWLDMLGFVDDNGDGVYEITEKARELFDVFNSIKPVLKLFSTIFSGIGKMLIAVAPMLRDIIDFIMPAVEWLLDKFVIINEWMINIYTKVFEFIKKIPQYLAVLKVLFSSLGDFLGKFFTNIWHGISNGFANMVNGIVNGFVSMINSFIDLLNNNKVTKAINKISGFFGKDNLVKFDKIDYTMNWKPYPAYATGGFPEDGFFYANSGELVGQFSNGRTAVANNDQIVTGITQGVYSAMMAYNAQTRGQGGSGDVYLDGTKVGRVVAKGSHQEMVRVGLIKANS